MRTKMFKYTQVQSGKKRRYAHPKENGTTAKASPPPKTRTKVEDVATNSREADGNSEGFAHNDNQVIESAEGNADADADVEDAATSHMDIYLKYMLYREKYQVYLDVEKAKTYTVT